MFADTTDRPGTEERYLTATNASDLTLNPDANCAATHLIAAGLLGNRMGEALIHLRAEWDTASKPRKPTDADVAALAAVMPKRKGKPDVKGARARSIVAHAAAMRECATRLRGRALALGLLREWAAMREVDPDLLSPALYHWLHATCPVCDGHGLLKVPDAPSLSAKRCHACDGAGTWPRPAGAQRVHDWMADCVGKAKGDRGRLLRGAPIADVLKSNKDLR